jgi:enamine deaminase RidA (YjgF/YER057c/UK114 family)
MLYPILLFRRMGYNKASRLSLLPLLLLLPFFLSFPQGICCCSPVPALTAIIPGKRHNIMTRQNLPGTSPYEPIIGFSRAVLVGNAIHISGTGPVGADQADAETQTRKILEIAAEVLARAGASFTDVVRTRIYLTRAADWESVGRVHGEVFRDIRPAATMVVVAQLLNPNWRVEIEFDAIVPSPEVP